ncbi:methylmalonyl-CoA mutase family protein [Actinomadura sp. CNU-125]|uniref:methylmalonyl-CoA mutase family protein n=1 Tax=Actinomadura sp. CNU-125 TaxID=1904961 RepID=UPI0021CCB047|nr:methylmalonyl-CoA mutase family protein [Actinomadura sp. CNU-125]
MTVPPEELELAAAFPPAERDRWREMVKGALRKSGGAATDDTPLAEIEGLLTRESYDGVPIGALYAAEDAPAGRPGLAPYVREVRPDGEGLAGWDVRQRHEHPDPAAAREAILADLENGATSIWLRLGEAGPARRRAAGRAARSSCSASPPSTWTRASTPRRPRRRSSRW